MAQLPAPSEAPTAALSAVQVEQDPAAAIEGLALRIELAESSFRLTRDDLALLDPIGPARGFDRELRRIERSAWVLEAEGLTPQEQRTLELSVLDALEYARYRLTQAQSTSAGAWTLSQLLREMRAALQGGSPELALALHVQVLGEEEYPRRVPPLLLRLLVALEAERARAVEALSEPARDPRSRPQAR